ncbi:MAG: ComF family protein [Paludibacteraceae bacterium]|nr:ComF family protein [Paludibacteraceae bacterium]MBQ4018207.1 ComF family protein [Paludibacteraceae bacterium]
MKTRYSLRTVLLSVLCPKTCALCGRYLSCGDERLTESGEREICAACMARLPRTEQGEIRQNETEMTLAGPGSDIVKQMKTLHLQRAAAYLYYEKDHPVRQLIYKMKYSDRPAIGYQLGHQAALEMQYTGFWDGIDVIVPIPLHPRRLRSRGYNQSEYIARGISAVTGIPIDTTHVLRIRNTPQQAKLKAQGEGRKANVEGAFAVNHPEQLYRKHILVVDDLLTTGETMRSCMRAMKAFRGASFSVFALCKAR